MTKLPAKTFEGELWVKAADLSILYAEYNEQIVGLTAKNDSLRKDAELLDFAQSKRATIYASLAEEGAKEAYRTLIEKNDDLTKELARVNALVQDNINSIKRLVADNVAANAKRYNLQDVLGSLNARLHNCMELDLTAREAFDSFYQEEVNNVLPIDKAKQ